MGAQAAVTTAGRRVRPVRTRRCPLGVVLLCGLTTAACPAPDDSPEAQISGLISQAERAAEAHDIGALKQLVAHDYRDERGYDRSSVVRLMQAYLIRHRSIHLLSKVLRITPITPDLVDTPILVAMAGRRHQSADELWDIRADAYRFDLRWGLDGGEWRVTAASWRRASVDDFIAD